MKKALAVILCISLVAASAVLVSCSKKENEPEPTTSAPNNAAAGGWEKAESNEITDEVIKLFEKAAKNLDGVSYTPIAYLASQIVAGKNHSIFCKAVTVTEKPEAKYVLVYIYENLEGKTEITNVVETGVGADYPENLDGGWSEASDYKMTESAEKAFNKSVETLTGAEYSPIALLASQVVAGMNYRILCQAKATVPNAQPYYVIITVYADLDGNAEITDTVEINAQ